MLSVNAGVAKQLAWQRFMEEVKMCQELCEYMDAELGAYMTLLGRMGVLKIRDRLNELPLAIKRKVFEGWARGAKAYGPWTLLQHVGPKRNDLVVDALFTDRIMLHPQYPWGVITLGGLMRAYSEVTEEIAKHIRKKLGEKIKDKTLKINKHTGEPIKKPDLEYYGGRKRAPGWFRKGIIEDEGREAWQKNLMDLGVYGGHLFKKGEVGRDWDKKNDKRHIQAKRKEVLQRHKEGYSDKDRLRYERMLKHQLPDVKGGTVEDKLLKAELRKWDENFNAMTPSWTSPGRIKWQTFMQDRISLVGDIYGLHRGATISGTTSDHAYSFWQLCEDLHSIEGEQSKRYKLLTNGVDRGKLWNEHSSETLSKALKTMQTHEGFWRVVRLMMLVPIVQMGIELHHSVHEMACVVGLNDLIDWRVGYYDTLYTTFKERKKQIERYEKGTKTGAVKPTKPIEAAKTLGKVDESIKSLLLKYSKRTCHGYFVTLDPHLVSVKDYRWGGVIVDKPNELAQHRQSAIVDVSRVRELNDMVYWDRITTDKGITKETLIRFFGTKVIGPLEDVKEIEVNDPKMTERGKVGLRIGGYKTPKIEEIKRRNINIWVRYKKSWQKKIAEGQKKL